MQSGWVFPNILYIECILKESLKKRIGEYFRSFGTDPLGNPGLVQVSLLVPKSVICLLSALYFHELTTQVPHEIHIVLPSNVPKPRIDYPPLEVYWLSNQSFSSGIGEYSLDGVTVPIYNREKTIADCFKFRKRIGLDIAIEALKDYIRQPNPHIDDILMYARINRVEKTIQPYIRTLLS